MVKKGYKFLQGLKRVSGKDKALHRVSGKDEALHRVTGSYRGYKG